jgi:hypothetical protein
VRSTADTITDGQIRELMYGEMGLLNEHIRDVCRVALRFGSPTNKRPCCAICGWRAGGPDSWDGNRCKCGRRAPVFLRCGVCHGVGVLPYDGVGTQPCGSCDGSGIFDSGETLLARARCAEIWNLHADRMDDSAETDLQADMDGR